MKKNIGVILAGGIGARLSKYYKKQYIELAGKECIAYVIDAFKNATRLDDFLVVVNPEQYDQGYIQKKYGVRCARGADTRNRSIYSGICYIRENFPQCERVIFHDAVRPFIRPDIVDDMIDLLDENVCAINSLDISDGIGRRQNTEVRREDYYISQTPEALRFPEFSRAFQPNSSIVALTHHLPPDVPIGHYHKFPYNLKLTFIEDVFVAEQLLAAGLPEYLKQLKEEDRQA